MARSGRPGRLRQRTLHPVVTEPRGQRRRPEGGEVVVEVAVLGGEDGGGEALASARASSVAAARRPASSRSAAMRRRAVPGGGAKAARLPAESAGETPAFPGMPRARFDLPVAENIRPSMHSLHEIRGFRTEVACSSCSLPVKISHTRQWTSWPVIPAQAGMTDFLGVCSRLDRGNSGSFGLCNNRVDSIVKDGGAPMSPAPSPPRPPPAAGTSPHLQAKSSFSSTSPPRPPRAAWTSPPRRSRAGIRAAPPSGRAARRWGRRSGPRRGSDASP